MVYFTENSQLLVPLQFFQNIWNMFKTD